jgi:hypothetical protein
VSPADELLLQELLFGYDDAKAAVREAIVAMAWPGKWGMSVTARTKTRDTLLEKIARLNGHGAALPQVQDIAGVRVVINGTMADQDAAAAGISSASFWDAPPQLVDRRLKPIQGYRAIHLTGATDGWNVEIQIRTVAQDAWANAYEAAGDTFGRSIRYPNFDKIMVVDPSISSIVAQLIELSLSRIGDLESAENSLGEFRALLRQRLQLTAPRGIPSDAHVANRESIRSIIREKLHPLERTVRARKASLIATCNDLYNMLDKGKSG